MAQFCTKCGNPMPEGMRFCTGCGATIGEPSAPLAQAPAVQAPFAPAPMMPSPAPAARAAAPAPAAKSGSPVVKIVLIVLAVLFFIGLLMAASCVYFVYRAKQRVSQFEKQARATFPVQTSTPQAPTQPAAPGQAPAEVSATPIDPAALIYPGATAKEGASMALGGFQVQQYETGDPTDKVLSYYKDKLGPKAMVQETNNQSLLQLAGPDGLLTITITRDEASGKTKISISHIGK